MNIKQNHLPRPLPAAWAWPLSIVICLTLLAITSPLAAQSGILGPAPLAPVVIRTFLASALQQRGGLVVDPKNREESIQFYNSYYVLPADLNSEWDGNHESCNSGTTTQRFRDAVLQRINYFRAMAGVPADISFSEEYNRKAQAAALMMSVNRAMDHHPPHGWRCYSADGADAAGYSNLYLQILSPNAIDGYMRDPGDGNLFVPHRRWLLFPQTMQMGSGDIPAVGDHPAANALWVVDGAHYYDARPATRDGFVAWPPPGFVPEPLIFDHWSLSYGGADFSGAQVAMTLNGQPLTLQVVRDGNGYGEATIAWQVDVVAIASHLATPGNDNAFSVEVSNVRVNSEIESFRYAVTSVTPPP